jgi:hypothetical protein
MIARFVSDANELLGNDDSDVLSRYLFHVDLHMIEESKYHRIRTTISFSTLGLNNLTK